MRVFFLLACRITQALQLHHGRSGVLVGMARPDPPKALLLALGDTMIQNRIIRTA